MVFLTCDRIHFLVFNKHCKTLFERRQISIDPFKSDLNFYSHAPSTRIRVFLNPQYFFRIRLPSTRIRRIRQRIRIFPLSRVKKKKKSATNLITCGRFESDDVAKSCPVSYRTINQYAGTICRPSFSRVNPDTIRCVWTGEFNLNTLRMDKKIFESGKKISGSMLVDEASDKPLVQSASLGRQYACIYIYFFSLHVFCILVVIR